MQGTAMYMLIHPETFLFPQTEGFKATSLKKNPNPKPQKPRNSSQQLNYI